MAVTVVPVRSRRDLRRFIHLPAALHRDHPQWVPPLYADEWGWHSPKKNLAFRYCVVTRALAWRDGALVGRVMGIVNRRHNEKTGVANARFSCLECVEDGEVCRALLAHVEAWARGLGMARVVGPLGFSDQDPQGLLIQGFEESSTIVHYYNFPYLPGLVEAEGYGKEVDLLNYRVPVPEGVPPLMERVARRAERRGLRVVEPESKRELRPYVLPVLRLLNETYQDIYGFAALDEGELADLARRYLPLLDARFVKMVEKGGEVVGFLIGMPDLHQGIQKARGRLLPLGFWHLLRSARRRKQLDLLLGGIREGQRGQGVDMLLGRAMVRSAREAGFERFDSHQMLETNTRVIAEMERWGGRLCKRYRIYAKAL